MPVTFGNIPLQQILFFPIEDAVARKRTLAVFGLYLAGFLIPIIPGIFLMGYMVQLLRRAARDHIVEMPAWDDWNRMLMDGLKSMAVSLAYLGPGWIVLAIGYLAYSVGIVWFSMQAGSNSADPTSTAPMFLGMTVFFLSLAVGMVLILLGSIPYPVALARFAAEGRLRAAFEIQAVLGALKANLAGFFGAWVVGLGMMYFAMMAYAIGYLTVVCCGIGMLAMILIMGWASLSMMAMVGLAYGESVPAPAKIGGG